MQDCLGRRIHANRTTVRPSGRNISTMKPTPLPISPSRSTAPNEISTLRMPSKVFVEHGGRLVTPGNGIDAQDNGIDAQDAHATGTGRGGGQGQLEVSPPHVVFARARAMFVAAECGSHWLSTLHPMQGADLVTVFQQPEESPSTFASRFAERLVAAADLGVEVNLAALAVASDFGFRRLEARSVIARTLLGTIGERSGGALVLVAPSASEHCWPHLIALADGLRERALRGCEVRLCLDCDIIAASGECETPTALLARLRELRLLDDSGSDGFEH